MMARLLDATQATAERVHKKDLDRITPATAA